MADAYQQEAYGSGSIGGGFDMGYTSNPSMGVVPDPGFGVTADPGKSFTSGVGYGLEMDPDDLDPHMVAARPKERLSDEERFEREVARKREQEMERRARIFDAKRRTIGVDKPALDQQTVERIQMRDLARQEKHMFDESQLRVEKQLKMMEIEKQRMKHQMEKECKEYSLQNLNFQSRREFDLNDPAFKKKDLPARVGDDDPRTGVSGLQKLAGEDLMKAERVQQQQQQQKNWIEQQKFEKTMLSKADQGDKDAFSSQVREITGLRNEMEDKEMHMRRELEIAHQLHNVQRATENRRGGGMGFNGEQVANARELEFHATDSFLNETGAHHRPDGRFSRTAYKGSTRQERMMVAGLQGEQDEETKDKKAWESHEKQCFEAQAENTRKTLVAMERDKQRTRRAMAQQMAQDNKVLRDQQYQAQKHLSTDVYTNRPTDEFFGQFGQSCR